MMEGLLSYLVRLLKVSLFGFAMLAVAVTAQEAETPVQELGELFDKSVEIGFETAAEYYSRKEADQLIHEGEKRIKSTGSTLESHFEQIKAAAKNEAANLLEEGASEARNILRDLARKSPPPTPVAVVEPIHSALSDEAIPIQTATFEDRPPPLLELGNPYFGEGYIDPGFVGPTGAVIQPQFFIFGTLRSGVQTFDPGTTDSRTTQWVNRLDLYANLNLTPTERILFGISPLKVDNNFSGYNFESPEGSGWQDDLNARVTAFFFEGNFLSIFPGLDNGRDYWLGFDFSIGRQNLNLQSGVLVNDNLDMIGLTHPSLFWFGSSATSVTALYAWGNVHRGNGVKVGDAQLLGGYIRSDFRTSTLEIDFFYSPSPQSGGGDGFYLSASAIQRLGKISTNFTVAASFAPDKLTPTQTTVNDGALLFVQLSTTPPDTEDVFYVNGFVAIERFTSASRAPDAGGPLGQTGVLFAATGLGDFGAALGSTATNSVGAAVGYQHFFDDLYRKQLIFEIGAQTETRGPSQGTVAAGLQYQQSIGQRWVFEAGIVGGVQRDKQPLYGLRMELDYNF